MRNLCICSIALLFICGFIAESTAQCTIEKKYFKSNPNDLGKFVTSPLRWKNKDLISAGAVAAIGVAAYSYDNQIMSVFQRNHTHLIDNSTKYFFQPMGNGKFAYPLVLFTFGLAYINEDCRMKLMALSAAKALVYTGILAQGIKYMAHRSRPYENEGPYAWGGPSFESQHHSFVSGHSSTVFAMASVAASAYVDKPIVKWIAYAIASGTAISRVYDHKHWASDVIGGAALGYAIGKFSYNSDIRRIDKYQVNIYPNIQGLTVACKF